ncbi:MAG: hypothetical protein ABL921_03620 [Pirellula sp.]
MKNEEQAAYPGGFDSTTNDQGGFLTFDSVFSLMELLSLGFGLVRGSLVGRSWVAHAECDRATVPMGIQLLEAFASEYRTRQVQSTFALWRALPIRVGAGLKRISCGSTLSYQGREVVYLRNELDM